MSDTLHCVVVVVVGSSVSYGAAGETADNSQNHRFTTLALMLTFMVGTIENTDSVFFVLVLS